MGDPVMTLGENELHRIGDYVRSNLKSWFYEAVPEVASLAGGVSNAQILERIVRVEERFEVVDIRFEAMDRKFGATQWLIGLGIVILGMLMSLYQFLS